MQKELDRPDPLYHATKAQRALTEKLGRKIKECRLSLCLTPEEFADDIGCTTGYVMKLEQGLIDPQMNILQRCAAALGIEVSELLAVATRKKGD